ncbi:thioredoxin family protein [Hathewaya histolytica]|uniref:thioredoxin family protein n=1 Tax=Hathewaya histolytica TaxID=1498 RepID=UPI003B6854A1
MIKLKSIREIEDFIEKNKIALLYFSSQDCNVCIELLPKIEYLLMSFPKINAREVEIEKLLSVTGKYSVFTLPCIIIFIKGKESIREARFISVKELQNKIERLCKYIT